MRLRATTRIRKKSQCGCSICLGYVIMGRQTGLLGQGSFGESCYIITSTVDAMGSLHTAQPDYHIISRIDLCQAQ
jgi:hypothetical protein